jgi:hypothetical protein
MPDPQKESPIGALSALALIGQVGLMVALPVAGGAVLGAWLDARWNARGLITVAAVLLGLVAGLAGAVRLLLKETRWKH